MQDGEVRISVSAGKNAAARRGEARRAELVWSRLTGQDMLLEARMVKKLRAKKGKRQES